MEYRVKIAPRALVDADECYHWIYEDSPEQARRWYAGLMDAISKLNIFPTRHPVAPESQRVSVEIRQLLYGKRSGTYRVLFHVREEQRTVVVIRIRHSARLGLKPDELDDLS